MLAMRENFLLLIGAVDMQGLLAERARPTPPLRRPCGRPAGDPAADRRRRWSWIVSVEDLNSSRAQSRRR